MRQTKHDLVGYNSSGIKRSSVTGADATGNVYVGGLTGRNNGGSEVVNSSTSDAQIDGDENVGGLVGSNSHDSEVVESWAAGTVNGNENSGGFIGFQEEEEGEDGVVTAGYWDTESSGQSEGIGSGDGDVTGLPTADMQGDTAKENMEELDFEETWMITGSDEYPVLPQQGPDTIDDADDGLP